MREAVIVAAARTAVGKAPRGSLKDTRPDDMAAVVLQELLKRCPGLPAEEIDDVIVGCALPEGEQGLNMARIAALKAGLPYSVPAMTINRFCSSGLQSIALGAERILAGFADVIVAGGSESMSMVPMSGNKFSANPTLAETYPQIYISMGLTAENVAQRFHISREDQDLFAVQSHRRAAAALQEGKFQEETFPLRTQIGTQNENGEPCFKEILFERDEGVRPDTSMEGLAKLKPAFKLRGTVTAGNSSQTSDGAAAVVIMTRERAQDLGLKPMASFRAYALAGVPPELMGIGPVEAVPRALKMAGISLKDVDLFELNEAFAAQALCVIRQLGLDPEKVNVNGGAIALGHPLGCTGAKLTATLLQEMKRRQARFGVVTMCIGGGMGAAGVFERTD